MANSPQTVTIENFDELVLASPVPVLLDFWMASCVPCMLVKRAVARAAETLGGEARVGLVNVNEQPDLVARFGVQGTPMFILVDGGRVVRSFGGMTTAAGLVQRVREHVAAA